MIDKQGIVHQIANVVENVSNHTYGYDIVGGGYFNDTVEGVRLWNISDAKDGDVLAYLIDEEDLWIMIYRSLYKPYEGHVHYHALLVNDEFSDNGTCCICIDNLKPSTKEQRDLLLQKMKEAGYTFDFEKKKLKKLKFKVGDEVITKNEKSLTITQIDEKGYWSDDLFICNFDSEFNWNLVEQKHTWSEEDERCKGCNNAKGCVACVDGSEWAHIEESYLE